MKLCKNPGQYVFHLLNNICASIPSCRLYAAITYSDNNIIACLKQNQISCDIHSSRSPTEKSTDIALLNQLIELHKGQNTLTTDAFAYNMILCSTFDPYTSLVDTLSQSTAQVTLVVCLNWNDVGVQRGMDKLLREIGYEIIWEYSAQTRWPNSKKYPKHRN